MSKPALLLIVKIRFVTFIANPNPSEGQNLIVSNLFRLNLLLLYIYVLKIIKAKESRDGGDSFA